MAKGLAQSATSVKIIASIPGGGRGFLVARTPETASNSSPEALSFTTSRGQKQTEYLNSIKSESVIPEPQISLQPFTNTEISRLSKPKSISEVFGEPIKPEQIGSLPAKPEPGEESIKVAISLGLHSEDEEFTGPAVIQGFFISRRSVNVPKMEAEFKRLEEVIPIPETVNTEAIKSKPEQQVPKTARNDLDFHVISSFREALSRMKVTRVRGLSSEVSTATQPQSRTLAAESTTSPVEAGTGLSEAQTEKPLATGINTRNYEIIHLGKGQRKVTFPPRLVIDEETNKARIEAIKAETKKQQAVNPEAIVSLGLSVIKAGVTHLKRFEAGLVRQLDLKKDGSQGWMYKDASFDKSKATEENIEKFVEQHTAVIEGQGPRVAGRQEIDRVVRPPDELGPAVNPEQVLSKVSIQELPEQRQNSQVANQEVAFSNIGETKPAEAVNEAQIEAIKVGILTINPNFVQSALDTWSNMTGLVKAFTPWRQQVFAE